MIYFMEIINRSNSISISGEWIIIPFPWYYEFNSWENFFFIRRKNERKKKMILLEIKDESNCIRRADNFGKFTLVDSL